MRIPLLLKNNYGKRRITAASVPEYLKKDYGVGESRLVRLKRIKGINPLLQNDFGVNNCCSVTSITSAVLFTGAGLEPNDMFNAVFKNAKRFFFGKRGTNPFMIKPIFDRTLRQFGRAGHTRAAFIKNVGVRFPMIEKTIDSGKPLVFSLWRDGRGYYRDHTVLVTGYAVYDTETGRRRFLILNDNWNRDVSYMDFDRLFPVCSVNYIK